MLVTAVAKLRASVLTCSSFWSAIDNAIKKKKIKKKNMRPDTGSFIEYLLFHSTSKSIILEETGLFLRWFACTVTGYNCGFQLNVKLLIICRKALSLLWSRGTPQRAILQREKNPMMDHISRSPPPPYPLSPAPPSAFISQVPNPGAGKKKIHKRKRDTGKWKHPLLLNRETRISWQVMKW